MKSLIVKNAMQALCFGLILSMIYYFKGVYPEFDLLVKNFVIYSGIYFGLSMLVDLVFKRNKK